MRLILVLFCVLAGVQAKAESLSAPVGERNGLEAGEIITVTGPVAAGEAGMALTHEHVMSLFGAPATAEPVYDLVALWAAVVPALRELRENGVGVLFDCTTEYFGRDPGLLRELSQESGVRIVTNTGYYGAAQGRYLPAGIEQLTVDEIAAKWITEARSGIGDTGIFPGFIKLGVNGGALTEVERKLVAAAARAHLATGLTIAVHTAGNVEGARTQLEVLAAEGVSPSAWIWVHAHEAGSLDALTSAARSGAWISLDGWSSASASKLLATMKGLSEAGLLERVLLSHDGNLFPALGRKPRPMRFLSGEGKRVLAEAGFGEDAWRLLTITNPANAFAVRVRASGAGGAAGL